MAPPPVSDPRPKPTIVDGFRYLTDLMMELASEPGKLQEVLTVIHAFNTGSMEVAAVVARMEDLLRGRTELIQEFNRFLPWSYIRAHGPAGGNIH